MSLGTFIIGFACGMLCWYGVLEWAQRPRLPVWLIEAESVNEAMNAVALEGFVPGLNCTGIRAEQCPYRKNTWKITIEYKMPEQSA